MKYTFKEVKYASESYKKTIVLRDEILRKPLGLKYTHEQLTVEKDFFHLACFDQYDNCLACLILQPISDKICKMRQVAVAGSHQGKGLGRSFVAFFESYAKSKGFDRIEVNARLAAVPFYEKVGYLKQGEIFYEVGIPHYFMVKEV